MANNNKIFGTGPNQVSLNGMLGDLAFQEKDNAEITGGAVASSKLELNPVYKQIATTAVDIFVYDTSKDSDGGAWRERCQSTSWYIEPLNTTVRGKRRDFPSVAVIVATSSSVTIYDGDDPDLSMWMVFTKGGAQTLATFDYSSPTCVHALNGDLFIGTRGSDNSVTLHQNYTQGLSRINFITDRAIRYKAGVGYSTIEKDKWSTNGLVNRNSNLFNSTSTDSVLNSFFSNYALWDVTAVALPSATTDPSTGLPSPTYIVGSDAGAFLVTDKGVVFSLLTNVGYIRYVTILEDFSLFFVGGDGVLYTGWGFSYIPTFSTNTPEYTLSTNAWSSSNLKRAGAAGTSALRPLCQRDDGFICFESTGSLSPTITTTKLISVSKNSTFGNSLVNYISTNYNTGWMPGDIKGAWLCDTNSDLLRSVTNIGANYITPASWTVQSNIAVTYNAGVTSITNASGSGLNKFAYLTLTVRPWTDYTLSFKFNANTAESALISYAPYSDTQYIATMTGQTSGTVSFNSNQYTTLYLHFGQISTTPTTITLIDLREGVADRSPSNIGLQAFNTITRTAVAPGADLVSYSGFATGTAATATYLRQLNSTAFTGDLFFAAWVYPTSSSPTYQHIIGIHGDDKAQDNINSLSIKYGTNLVPYVFTNNASVAQTATPLSLNKWQMVVVTRASGVWKLYVNGVVGSTSTTATNTIQGSAIVVGVGNAVSGSFNEASVHNLALIRYGVTAPTDAQILKMYNDERQLFQPDAKSTIYPSSNSYVYGLAYDKDTKLIHVGTSSGRSVFQGLTRIDFSNNPISTSISAANGLVAEQ